MESLQLVHVVAVVIGLLFGIGGTIWAGGKWAGRIEERLKTNFQEAVAVSERRIEDKVEGARESFDETLKGLRQKINDVELQSERRYLPKEEFNDFRAEYREDVRDLKLLIANNKVH